MELLLLLGAVMLLGGGRKPAGASVPANPTKLTPMEPGGSTGHGATFTSPVKVALPPADGTDIAPAHYTPGAATIAPSTAPTLTGGIAQASPSPGEIAQAAAPVEVPYHQLNGPLAPTPGLQTAPATARVL
jgi:hypothetical protein